MQRVRRGKGEAPGSVRSHVRAEDSGLSARDPDGRAVVKEAFGAAPGEGFVGGHLPDGVEKFECLTVGEAPHEGEQARDINARHSAVLSGQPFSTELKLCLLLSPNNRCFHQKLRVTRIKACRPSTLFDFIKFI